MSIEDDTLANGFPFDDHDTVRAPEPDPLADSEQSLSWPAAQPPAPDIESIEPPAEHWRPSRRLIAAGTVGVLALTALFGYAVNRFGGGDSPRRTTVASSTPEGSPTGQTTAPAVGSPSPSSTDLSSGTTTANASPSTSESAPSTPEASHFGPLDTPLTPAEIGRAHV